MPTDNTPYMIVLGAILLLILYYLFCGKPSHNEGQLQFKTVSDDLSAEYNNDSSDDSNGSDYSSNVTNQEDSYDSNTTDQSNTTYRSTNTEQISPSVDTQFNVSNVSDVSDVSNVTKNYTDRFAPIDESDIQNSPVSINNIKGTEKDKYNVDALLPQEKEKDWFETIETVDVKNTHLINIYRPIGANTIGSTHKAAIYDIRGLDKAVCPKFVVSPWLQSSYEPDRSSKSLCV